MYDFKYRNNKNKTNNPISRNSHRDRKKQYTASDEGEGLQNQH